MVNSYLSVVVLVPVTPPDDGDDDDDNYLLSLYHHQWWWCLYQLWWLHQELQEPAVPGLQVAELPCWKTDDNSNMSFDY